MWSYYKNHKRNNSEDYTTYWDFSSTLTAVKLNALCSRKFEIPISNLMSNTSHRG